VITHHIGAVLPKARMKFSVLMEKSSELQITRVLLLGGGRTVTKRLPTIVAIPVTMLTIPRDNSPPPARESIIAGNAALNMDAVKLIIARNRIKSRIPRFSFKYRNPNKPIDLHI